MAMGSLALVFLLTTSTVLAVPSASATGNGNGAGALEKLCNVTMYRDYCMETLTPSPRRLAETAFAVLARDGPALFAESGREFSDASDKNNQTLMTCFGVLKGNMQRYVANLCGVELGRSDAELADAKARLESLLDAPSSTGVSCGNEDLHEQKPIIVRVVNYEAMMQITLDLITALVQTKSAPAPAGRAEAPAPGSGRAEAPTA